MLGELQSIYDVNNQKLSKLTRGLTVMDPDEVGPSDDPLVILNDQASMPEAVKTVVETPSSLANDSQLHQLLSNMHNQLKDLEGNDSEEDDALDEVVLGGQNLNHGASNDIDDELTLAKEIADSNKDILSKNNAHHH